MNQRIGICFHGTRILPISIAHRGFFDEHHMQCMCNGWLNPSLVFIFHFGAAHLYLDPVHLYSDPVHLFSGLVHFTFECWE